MRAKRQARTTFADIVAQLPAATERVTSFSYAVPHPWITVDGERWHLRGDASYEGKDLRKLLRQSGLPAFHEYVGKRVALGMDERESFWRRAVAYMQASEYSAFVGYEYKHLGGGRCLVVYEFC